MATCVFLSSLFRSTSRRFPLSRPSPSPTNALLSRFSEYSSATNVRIKSMFEDWMKIHNKSYPSEKEEKKRYKIFKEKVLFAEEKCRSLGDRYYFVIALNEFGDWTTSEHQMFLRQPTCQPLLEEVILRRIHPYQNGSGTDHVFEVINREIVYSKLKET